jgi:predicted DNA-binding transcriptional regulator YafY
VEFKELPTEHFVSHKGVNFDRYFDDLIGVTKTEKDRAQKVILQIDKPNAPYVLTKPIHSSQKLLKEDEAGALIRIDVVLNFELEREILGFGENMKVLAPRILAKRIEKRLKLASGKYEAVSE